MSCFSSRKGSWCNDDIRHLKDNLAAEKSKNRRLRSLIEKGFPKLLEHMEYDLADEYDRALHPKSDDLTAKSPKGEK